MAQATAPILDSTGQSGLEAHALLRQFASDSLTLTGTDSITGGDLTNLGTLNADGTVTFDSLTVTNTGASITVGSGDTLTLNGTDSITGGSLTNLGTWLLYTSPSPRDAS